MEAVEAAIPAVRLVHTTAAVDRTLSQRAVVYFGDLAVVRSTVDVPEVIRERNCSGCTGCRSLCCLFGRVVLCLFVVGRNCSLCYRAACHSLGSLVTAVDFGLCCTRFAEAMGDVVGRVDLMQLVV